MKIIFIQTGGTIDKDYPKTTKGYAFEFGEPATQRILEKLHPSFEFEIITAFQKDSLEIDDNDRKSLLQLIRNQHSKRFIITHGTDTMIETAQYLAQHLKDKIIVLTGAMRPERFTNSDAAANVGIAIGAVQTLGSGVYITMHGIVKSASEIQRNMENGQFY
jgi:L-asparaginase